MLVFLLFLSQIGLSWEMASKVSSEDLANCSFRSVVAFKKLDGRALIYPKAVSMGRHGSASDILGKIVFPSVKSLGVKGMDDEFSVVIAANGDPRVFFYNGPSIQLEKRCQ